MASVGKSNQGDKIVAKQRQRRSYLHLSVAGDKTDNSGTQRAYVIGFYLVKSVKIGFSISFIVGNFGLWIRISGKAFSFMTSHLSERKKDGTELSLSQLGKQHLLIYHMYHT